MTKLKKTQNFKTLKQQYDKLQKIKKIKKFKKNNLKCDKTQELKMWHN